MLSRLSAGALLTIALIRLTSTTSTLPYWETDPAIQLLPETTITPATSLMLDAITWLVCGIAFTSFAQAKRAIHSWTVVAALIGAAVSLMHGFAEIDGSVPSTTDLVRGSLWASSMIAAVTLAHLAGDRSIKRLCLACLAGAGVYLGAKGMFQAFVEHPRFIEEFEQNREKILAAQGIEPGSPNALIYERRLRQPEATGWGGLSNTLATVTAAGALAWIALTILVRNAVDKDRAGLLGITAVAGLVCATGLWFSNSRAGLAIALLVAALIPFSTRLPRRIGRWSIVGLCAVMVLGVIAQGVLGPSVGDLSLFFRAQYWQGATGVFAANPIFGIGAGSFQNAFLLHRPPTCPEEVESAHNVFVDWFVALGLFAIPWIWIVLSSLLRAGGRLFANEKPSDDDDPIRANVLSLAAIVLAVFAWGAWLEWEVLFPDELFVRSMAAALWIGAGAIYFTLSSKLSERAEAVLWAMLACTVAVHSMIEMTLSMNTTVMWGLAVVLVAGLSSSKVTKLTSIAPVLVTACSLLAFGRLGIESIALYADQGYLLSGASIASEQVESQPNEQSLVAEIHRENGVISMLGKGCSWHCSPRIVSLQIERCLRLAQYNQAIGRHERSENALIWAQRILESAKNHHPQSAEVFMTDGRLLEAFGYVIAARDSYHRAAELDPWGLEPARSLFLINIEIGDLDAARTSARRLLDVDDAKYLDPLRGLSEAERAQVEAFLAQETASPAR